MKKREFNRTVYEESLVERLNEGAARQGLAPDPDFSEVLKPPTLHLLLADRRAGLVARVKRLEEGDLEKITLNLELVTAAAAGGAPVLPPAMTEVLVAENKGLTYGITFWPLADNRLVSPAEMAEVLRGIHDLRPLRGMPDCMQIRFGRVKRWVKELPGLTGPPPKDVITKCRSLVDGAMEALEPQMAAAPKRFLHGDAHPANIVILKGRPLACDLDEICSGPAEVDLSMAFIQSERYPGSDASAGENLARAYGRPYNAKLLRAIIRARCVSRALSLVRFWGEPGVENDFYQRLDAIENGGKFSKLYGGESLAMFAGP
ncbi:aminoglycoside phosphotransferase family protein [Candidatus Saccharibacteria bacterium]|nr:aminoglycoside phosphotransferase family protein [Candidatus Saccharibacteria bacterium]